MRIVSFKGGIHPPDGKSFSADKETQVIWPKQGAELLYPMTQHIGAPCEPIVSKGERVLIGQKIAQTNAFVSAPIHASVSGVVKDIRDTVTSTGIISPAIVIENDGIREESPEINQVKDFLQLSKEEILDIIKDAGIVGLGGAGFPTHIKLNPPIEKVITTIIVNAAECEPYLTTDYRVLLEETERLVRGLRIMLHLHPQAKGMIAIETNKPDALKKMSDYCRAYPEIEVLGLKTKYPQGAEKQLIWACTGKQVPSGGLPADIGCLVDNVDTVIAIDRAITRGRPLTRKIITISGDAIANPGNYKIRIGMKFIDLIEAIGGFIAEPYKIISGGPMMGVALYTLDAPTTKTSAALLCLTKEWAELPPETNCIRCGKCVKACPAGLIPLDLNQYVLHRDWEMFRKCNGLDCIECGSCTYVCPAKRHITQSIRVARRDMLAKKI